MLALHPKGIILSGSPASVYEPGAPFLPPYVLESGLPVLGICFGMQGLTHTLGGRVAPAQQREYGPATVESLGENPLLPPGEYPVWMSHGDRIEQAPPGFVPLARSGNSPVAMIGDLQRHIFGVQFHPEVRHTPGGKELLRRFVVEVCGAQPDWTLDSIIHAAVKRIRQQVGGERVLVAVSGGGHLSGATPAGHPAPPVHRAAKAIVGTRIRTSAADRRPSLYFSVIRSGKTAKRTVRSPRPWIPMTDMA